MRKITLLLLIPFYSLSQSNKTTDVSNSIRTKSYASSAGTFTIEQNSSAEHNALPDKIDFIESITKTTDGGTATFIYNKDAIEFEDEQAASEITVEITVSPNPLDKIATVMIDNIEMNFTKTRFIIYDMLGKEVRQTHITDYNFQFDRENLNDGIYLFKVIDNNIFIATGKIVFISNK